MATTDTKVPSLIINRLSKSLYDNLASKSDTELYLVPDIQDSMPTQNSTNNVTSGGVYTAIQSRLLTITSTNKLSADLILDGTTNKVYTATEKTKLSGIEENANNYTLPIASSNTLGGITVGEGLNIITSTGKLFLTAPGDTTLGGVANYGYISSNNSPIYIYDGMLFLRDKNDLDIKRAEIDRNIFTKVLFEQDNVYLKRDNNDITPLNHPDLSTLPSTVPQRFGKLPISEVLLAYNGESSTISDMYMINNNSQYLKFKEGSIIPNNSTIISISLFGLGICVSPSVIKINNEWRVYLPVSIEEYLDKFEYALIRYYGNSRYYYQLNNSFSVLDVLTINGNILPADSNWDLVVSGAGMPYGIKIPGTNYYMGLKYVYSANGDVSGEYFNKLSYSDGGVACQYYVTPPPEYSSLMMNLDVSYEVYVNIDNIKHNLDLINSNYHPGSGSGAIINSYILSEYQPVWAQGGQINLMTGEVDQSATSDSRLNYVIPAFYKS